MSDTPTPPPGQPGATPPAGGDGGGPYSQQVQYASVSARVPDRVTRGAFSTGFTVLTGPQEFVVDFIQGLTRPHLVTARLVLPPAVMGEFAAALRDNLRKYAERFGAIAPLAKPTTNRRPTIQEIYDELKIPDDVIAGSYANAVMIGHSQTEFFFDFIARLFPQAVVTARVYLAAPQAPRLLEAVSAALRQLQQVQQSQQPPQSPPPDAGTP